MRHIRPFIVFCRSLLSTNPASPCIYLNSYTMYAAQGCVHIGGRERERERREGKKKREKEREREKRERDKETERGRKEKREGVLHGPWPAFLEVIWVLCHLKTHLKPGWLTVQGKRLQQLKGSYIAADSHRHRCREAYWRIACNFHNKFYSLF